MIDRKSKKRRLYLSWLAVVVLAVVFVAPAFAQEDPNDPVLPDPNMPEEHRLPGTVEGTGTYFEVTDSNYLNITFESTEPVHLRLESVPEMVVMDINTADSATSTQVTMTGFEPSTTYYKYEDDYHNGVPFTTDLNGSYSYVQELSEPHLVFIQPQPGTRYIPTDTYIGTWDSVNRIYTLTTDVSGTIQIDQDNLTLDGAGHTVTGTGGGIGVYLRNRTGVTIKNVNVHGFYYGIYIRDSSDNTLTGNTASNNAEGIRLVWSNDNTLTGNTASSNNCGIYILYSSNNTLTGNTAFSNEWYGIYLDYSGVSTLSGNTMSANGYNFFLFGDLDSHFDNYIDTTNTVDGKPVYYVKNAANQVYDNSTIPNAGVLYCINCNNITIRDLTLTNDYYGLFLWKTQNSSIENVVASDNVHGIYIRYSSGNSLKGNTASDNKWGIWLWGCSNNTMTNNTASSNNSYGIRLLNSSSGNNLTDNTASYNSVGIGLGSYCGLNTLIGNTTSNNGSGIFLYRFSNDNILTSNTTSNNGIGINVHSSYRNRLTGNTASGNSTGIYSWYSSYNTLIENKVFSNTNYGIYLGHSNGNQIYNNNFIDNTTQAYVYGGSGNVFNLSKPTGGNYWSDWVSPDADGDGFVDYPYVFDGGQDNLPWTVPDDWLVTLVEIDIKPGSYPNAINLGSYGLVPVAILSSDQFDATTVDPDTVELSGAGVEVRGKSNKFMAHEEDVNGDDLVDLLLQVATQNLDPDSFQDGYAILTGETYDGKRIEGKDEITIVPPEP